MPSFGSPISLKGPQGVPGLTPTTSNGPRTDTASEGQTNLDLTNFVIQTYSNGAWTSSRSFAGTQGIQGEVGFFGYGNAAPDSTTYAGDANGFYLRSNGEVYFYSQSGGWKDSGENLVGPAGATGAQGQRGSYRFVQNNPPPSDPSTLTPTPMVGDEFVDTSTTQGPNPPYISYYT